MFQLPNVLQLAWEKLQSASNQNFQSIPITVKEHFQLTKSLYKSSDFKVVVSFSGMI